MAQIETKPVGCSTIFRHLAFRAGVEDVRTGRRPRFDAQWDDDLFYEYGRLWAAAAPSVMKPFIAGRLNPEAVEILAEAIPDEH